MHQSLFSPPSQTIVEAANHNQLQDIPCLNSPKQVKKYLALSPATSKGRLKKQRANVRTTRNRTTTIPPRSQTSDYIRTEEIMDEIDVPPSTDARPNVIENTENVCNVFCCAALGDATTGVFYTDMTGAFPVTSLENMQAYFVAYDYDTNNIFALPVPNFKDETVITAFEEIFNYLKDKGYTPTFNVTDNQATTPIKAFIKKEGCKWQFVEPNNHRINAAERAIQTFKNHFISGLSSTDKHWPLQLWDHLTKQATTTLNILRKSQIYPTKSAYEQLKGHTYDWNAHPMVPPGTRAVMHVDAVTRTSWGPRGLDAWCCGPAMDHYRCSYLYIPKTGSIRISGSFDMFPQHCIMPTFTREQHATEVHNKLKEAVSGLSKNTKKKVLGAMTKTIEDITEQQANPPQRVVDQPTSEGGNLEQRVGPAPPVTTTSNPTAPARTQAAPMTHTRNTRHNTPGIMSQIKRPKAAVRKSSRLNPHLVPDTPIVNCYDYTQLRAHSFLFNILRSQNNIAGGGQPHNSKGVGHTRRCLDTKRHTGAQPNRTSFSGWIPRSRHRSFLCSSCTPRHRRNYHSV